MDGDIPPIPDETHAAIVALIGRLERSILEVRACAEGRPRINEDPAQSDAANAVNLAHAGVPVGSRVAGWIVYDPLGKAIGWVTSDGSFVAGEPPVFPPFARPAGELRNAEDRARIDKLFEAAVNIRSILGDLRNALDSFPSDIRKEIRNLAIWRMAGGPVSLWVGAAEPHLQALRTLLQRALQSEMQADQRRSDAENQDGSNKEEAEAKRKAEEERKPREAPQIEAKVARGPKRHKYTEFILGLWDSGERNREVIKRQFVNQLSTSKRRTKEEEEKLFAQWWANAAKHRPEMWSESK